MKCGVNVMSLYVTTSPSVVQNSSVAPVSVLSAWFQQEDRTKCLMHEEIIPIAVPSLGNRMGFNA